MPIAPSGAVSKMASTATESTRFPQGRPIASGVAPIAACTVALGKYAITQNSRSFFVSFVPATQRHTPTERMTSASAISPEEALEACEKADLGLDSWQNLRVSRLELGYIMLAQNLAGTEIDARPAWLIRIWGEIFGETESIAVAVDAQTGNILAM